MSIRELFLAAAAILLAGTSMVVAQTGGAISGTVRDAQGAVIPTAKVVLANEAQGGVPREVATSPEGTFVFTPVLPGTYTLTVEMSGFKKYTQSGVKLDVNDKLGLPAIALEVGSTGESVTVEARAVQLHTITVERSGG